VAFLTRPDGVELYWQEQGEGPLVVLALQFFGSPAVFERLIAALGEENRVVTYHLRGTGRSTRRGPYDLETDSGDLVAVAEEAGGGAVLVAMGDGCDRAVKAAASRPDLISAVVCSGGNPVGRIAAQGTESLAGSDSVIEALTSLIETDYRSALRTMLDTANPQLDEDDLRGRVNTTVEHCPHEAAAPRFRAWVTDDVTEEAKELGERLWILEHGHNPWFPIEVARATRELLPDAHVEEVADGPFSRPDLTAACVRGITAAQGVQR
jgi:pimeloyl-ACP methyl ester carboxylesterase